MAVVSEGNTAWVLAATALVLVMTPGLAFFYGGMVRSKNVLAMLMQSFFAMGLVSVLWALVGFSLAFGESGEWVGSFDFVGLIKLGHSDASIPGYAGDLALTIPPLVFCAFQMMFAIITPALFTGAVADRMKFAAYVVFLGLWSIVVYCTVAHWVFSPTGWLYQQGARDFAGGTVVHTNAGIAALVLVVVLGRRRGWPGEAMPPHALPFTLFGAGLLWFGWFGFNAGSALKANDVAAQALVNTHLSAAAAMLGWLVVEWRKGGRATTLGAASGLVAGLVTITPCAGYVDGWASLIIGFVAGAVCYLAIQLKFRFGYDDSLDVVAIHLVGGITGSLLLGLFANRGVNSDVGSNGIFLPGGGVGLLANQAVAVVATLVFSGVVSFVLAKVVDAVIGLRVPSDEEMEGLDITQHSETAYSFGELGSMGRAG